MWLLGWVNDRRGPDKVRVRCEFTELGLELCTAANCSKSATAGAGGGIEGCGHTVTVTATPNPMSMASEL